MGAVNESVGAVIALVVGIALATMMILLTNSLGGQAFSVVEPSLDDIGVTDETENATVLLNEGTTLSCTPVLSDGFSARNASASGTVISSGNYSLTTATGLFNLTNVQYNNSNIFFAYECGDATMRTQVYNSIREGFGAGEDTASYLPLIILAVVVALVLSVVLGFVGNNFKSGGGAL